jgi:hypothetical protein
MEAIDAMVIYFQSTANFPRWTSTLFTLDVKAAIDLFG